MQRIPEPTSRVELPLELSTFIGREHELAELRQLLAGARLLTLTGSGGSGKTRLALEAVKHAAADASFDVVWVELAPLDDAAHLAQHVADACGITEEIRGGDTRVLVSLLAGRKLLLVIDNCEHVVDACAELADTLLRACPRLRILATSREALGVKGERAWLVPALPQPEAIRLFVERARDFAGEFNLTEQNASAVAEICVRLDGIPLAIELAAARVKLLTPEQLRDRLDDAFSLLKSSYRTPIRRHRTLAAAIDWSYDLLTEDERILFRRIAAFRGGFTLDAVEAIGSDQADVLGLLARLVDRSLVAVREQNGAARYYLLETVLQYARHKLTESDEAAVIHRRHADFVFGMVAEAEPHFIRASRPLWIKRLVPELENIREALAWTRRYDPALHVRLAGILWWFWYSMRLWTEARCVIDNALVLPEATQNDHDRAKLRFADGALGALQAKPDAARSALEESITLAERSGDEQLSAYARTYLAMTYAGEAKPEGKALCERAAVWFEQNNDIYGLRLTLLLLATTAAGGGALDEAAELSRRGVQMAREFGQARELAIALHTQSMVHTVRGDFERAKRLIVESLQLSRSDASYFSIALTLDCLAEIVGREGRPLDAARLIGAAEQLRAAIGAAPFKYSEKRLAVVVTELRDAVSEAAFEAARRAGAELTLEQVIDEVLAAHSAPPATAETVAPRTQAAPDVTLRVNALGPLEVTIDGRIMPPETWTYAKPKELLVYLLCYPAGRTRDHIARALWPDATPAQLKNSFHVTLHHLRKTLGRSEWIVVEDERYRIATDVSYAFDAAIFEQVVRSALKNGSATIEALRTAVALYRGDLLEGEVTTAWLEEHADRLRRLYVDASLALGRMLESDDQIAAAVDIYLQITARDDLQEEAHRRLLLCWTRMGERPRALRHYERLVTLLRDVLDAEPEQETADVYQRIRAAERV